MTGERAWPEPDDGGWRRDDAAGCLWSLLVVVAVVGVAVGVGAWIAGRS